jgi:exodeoxyribonuclease VII small subunit
MSDTAVDASKIESYDEAKRLLNEIVDEVRRKDVSLERSLDLLEDGVKLANRCTELIDQASWDEAAAPVSAAGEDAEAADESGEDAEDDANDSNAPTEDADDAEEAPETNDDEVGEADATAADTDEDTGSHTDAQ